MNRRDIERAFKLACAFRFKERQHFHHDHEIRSWRNSEFWYGEIVGTVDLIVADSRKKALAGAREVIEHLFPLGNLYGGD